MAANNNKMKLSEKITLIVSILSFLVAFLGFIFSESILGLSKSVEVISITESTNLNSLTSENGYIDTLTLKNIGNKTSKDIKLILTFSREVPKYELFSDEDVVKKEAGKHKLQISLNRLANNSKLKLVMFSENKLSYQTHYIDDNGKSEITEFSGVTSRNYWDVLPMFVVVISMGVIVWIFRRTSNSNIEAALESHQRDFQEKLREIKDEIGNIEVTITPTSGIPTDTGGSDERGITQRLVDLIKI
ncbi:hypothetical protein Q4489_14120 [Thalassotalea sp. 1_MG-2023]|uniref:hypothetical protein n=1 Tax=Thalassotalea sp. 1_MG-2023 TaxID=3062680 RepID=UPI0026E417B2|nr:hypothetical protein [Thalassotalea sp. 1_MG-2023]MDO6428152.1 hypothetical protein [Thalassotalea sp. 1_MG-2023]